MYQPNSGVERISLPYHIVGRSLVDVVGQHHSQVNPLRVYVYEKREAILLHAAVYKQN